MINHMFFLIAETGSQILHSVWCFFNTNYMRIPSLCSQLAPIRSHSNVCNGVPALHSAGCLRGASRPPTEHPLFDGPDGADTGGGEADGREAGRADRCAPAHLHRAHHGHGTHHQPADHVQHSSYQHQSANDHPSVDQRNPTHWVFYRSSYNFTITYFCDLR